MNTEPLISSDGAFITAIGFSIPMAASILSMTRDQLGLKVKGIDYLRLVQIANLLQLATLRAS